MRVYQLMTPTVVTIAKSKSLMEAVELMEKNKVSRLLVTDDGKIAGTLTEKDIIRGLGTPQAYRVPPSRIHVSGVMGRDPITVEPELTAKRAAELMLERNISGLPVVAGSELRGILTKMDFTKICFDYGDIYVGEVMETTPITVSPDDRVLYARKLMLEEGVGALPVLVERELVGLLTTREVALKLAAFHEVAEDTRRSERVKNLLVGDIMLRPPVTVRTDATLGEAARLMWEKKISGVPVVNLEGGLAGLLTKTELVEVARERL
ncbi:MAG: CBS domain-containing protein [Candidatus Hadarchaeales archaeon]